MDLLGLETKLYGLRVSIFNNFPRYVMFLQINPIIFVWLIQNQILLTQGVKPVL